MIAQDSFKVYLDTKQVELTDKGGSNMTSFKYNEKTYLPLKPIANLSGLDCKWNKDAITIGIYDKSSDKEEVISTFKSNVKSRFEDIIVQ